ncbi:MAG: thiamine-phosphate pyrophosphorylase [Abditibacteriota bacterium]|nr:thiamine-phosphate pyrophosphorylase [Abditibacteriota bacterium]
MSLARLLLITDRTLMQPTFEVALLSALRGGARLVHLREKDMAPRDVLAQVFKAQRLVEVYGAKLLINARADIARAAHLEGVHLPENDLSPRDARSTLGHHALCGVSTHSLETAQRAAQEGADYIVFGPVFPTPSHPEASGCGLDALRQVTEKVSIPVFAIGGINAGNARDCRLAGAHGVAVIRSVWQSENVEAAVRELVQAVDLPL